MARCSALARSLLVCGLLCLARSHAEPSSACPDVTALVQGALQVHASPSGVDPQLLDVVKGMPLVKYLMKELTSNMTMPEIQGMLKASLKSDKLLGRLEGIANMLRANATGIEYKTQMDLDKLVAKAKDTSNEYVVPLIQEFFIEQANIAGMAASAMTQVTALLMSSMPPEAAEKFKPAILKMVNKTGAQFYGANVVFQDLGDAPRPSFCKMIKPVLKNTSSKEKSFKSNQVMFNETSQVLLPAIQALVDTADVKKVMNTTVKFMNVLDETLTRFHAVNAMMVDKVGELVLHRVHCMWNSSS